MTRIHIKISMQIANLLPNNNEVISVQNFKIHKWNVILFTAVDIGEQAIYNNRLIFVFENF